MLLTFTVTVAGHLQPDIYDVAVCDRCNYEPSVLGMSQPNRTVTLTLP